MSQSHCYEIYRRESGQHRAGQFALMIDGIDADVTVDPSQFMPKALREALEAGADPADPTAAAEIADEYARRALQRRVDRLRAGSLMVGGLPMSETGTLDTRRMPRKPRRDETTAVEAFLNRGLLNGLNKQERLDLAKRRADKQDCQADWLARRAKLIELREQELAEVLKVGGPKAERRVRILEGELAALKAPIVAASHGFQSAYVLYWTGAVDLVNNDIRIWPLMTNTSADTERDGIDTLSEFTTLDEFDGANYSSGGLALDSQAVAVDDANDRAEFDAADETVSALGAGTRSIQGVLLGKFVTNTNASLPLHWLEFASNKTPDGSDFTFQFNAEGLLQQVDG